VKNLTPAIAGRNVQEHLRVISIWTGVKSLHKQSQVRLIEVKLIEVKPLDTDVFFHSRCFASKHDFARSKSFVCSKSFWNVARKSDGTSHGVDLGFE
jgi:hypothetical protein